jgi:hypothetical protein
LPIILAHTGGPLLAAEAVVAATVCPNIYLELSSLMPHHLGEILAHVSPGRLMVGSDLPESIEAELGKIVNLEIDAGARAAILWDTARRVIDGVTP